MIKITKGLFLSLAIMFVLLTGNVYSNELEDAEKQVGLKAESLIGGIEVGAKSGFITGETTYHISFPVDILGTTYTGESELEFPIYNWMLGGNFSIGGRDSILSLNAEGWINLEDDAGDDMTDKDWMADSLFSWTESNTEAEILIWDVNLRYNFYHKSLADRKGKAGFLLGYKHQRFDYDIYDVNQYDPLGLYGSGLVYTGKCLEYEVEFDLPYLGLGADYEKEKWGIGLDIRYSPYARAEDFDDHLLRGKSSGADCKGDAWLLRLSGLWKLSEDWKLNIGLDYTVIDTEGSQTQRWYKDELTCSGTIPAGTEISDIDVDITSNQWLVWCGVTYEF